jgi:hypothetical protein
VTTTGEYLVSISTLATGSALDHFLNIETGGGEIRYVTADIASIALPAAADLGLTGSDGELALTADDSNSLEPAADLRLSGGGDLEVDP